MSLTSSLQIGRTGLLAHQAGLEVTGNNLANVATPGFSRQQVELGAAGDRIAGDNFIGSGVAINAITRQVNEAVESRLRVAIADQGGAAVLQGRLEQLEALQNELSGNDLSTSLDNYFDAFSQLSTNPQDSALRGLVVSEGVSLAGFVQDLSSGYVDLQVESNNLLAQSVDTANGLLDRVEELNSAIRELEGASNGQVSSLRDQRDAVLEELAELIEIDVTEAADGSVDVFVGSTPVVLVGRSRGLELRTRTVGEVEVVELATVDGGVRVDAGAGAGAIAAYVDFNNGALADATQGLDELAGQLIFQTNLAHSQSQAINPANTYVGSYAALDADASLGDSEASGLDFEANNGSFDVRVSAGSGAPAQTTRISVDLDGLGGPDTTLNDLAAQLDAVDGVEASVDASGRLRINGSTQGTEISFAQDSSGALAVLGIGGFFSGSSAADIAVDAAIQSDTSRLAVARGNIAGDNRGALAIADLRDLGLEALGGRSISQTLTDQIAQDAAELGRVRDSQAAAAVVTDNLRAQQSAVSGVNADEETINLIQYQRAYQASARFLTVVDELVQTLLNIT